MEFSIIRKDEILILESTTESILTFFFLAMGFVLDDKTLMPINDWAFEWQAPIIFCEVIENNLIAYTEHFIEIWQLSTGI